MYSDKTLYYLNQMGIRAWIKRPNSLSLLQLATAKQIEESKKGSLRGGVKLQVFISSNLSIKAQSLLAQMMAYLNLQEHELNIIPVQENEPLSNYDAKIEQQTPLAILVLGLDHYQFVTSVNTDCLVVNSIDPNYLIANPAEKRKVFKDLHYLMQLVS
ncbi:DNA polymerase III subunit psi [Legionella sp.]|uniref:DNA polymerase III subunit psi n=1 Tax=Legionella sp. TaxID=459 RepID=UPI003C9A57D4